MLESYLTLRRRVDRFAASVRARYRDQVACRTGCFDCCQSGLTLMLIEAVAIGNGLGVSEDRVVLQAGQPPLKGKGYCTFLDDSGLCTIYSNRPIICRTHGYPLKYDDQDGIGICEKNFVDVDPHHSVVLDVDNLDAALFAVNLDYCRREGLNPLARVPIDRIARLIDLKKDRQRI